MTDRKLPGGYARQARHTFRSTAALVAFFVTLGGHASVVFARAGDLDTSFGANGGVADGIVQGASSVNALVIQPDGKIVVAGEASQGPNLDFALVRYNTDGTRDTTFGTNGVVLTPIGDSDETAYALALQPDGMLIAAGVVFKGGQADFALARYAPDGSLDQDFGLTGRVTTDFDAGDDAVAAVLIQPDGKIVAVGTGVVAGQQRFALARYNANGSLDTTFGESNPTPQTGKTGLRTTAFGSGAAGARAAVLLPDGKLVAAGSAQTNFPAKPLDFDFALARYNTDGTLDTSFGGGGLQNTTFGSRGDVVNALLLQPDGKVVAAGLAKLSSDAFGLVRYNSDGSLDTSFQKTGKVAYPFNGAANAAAFQADGKIIAAGVSNARGLDQFGLLRLRTDGGLDRPTFGGSGAVVTALPISIAANAVAVQPDGKIVAAGSLGEGSGQAIFLVRYLADPPYTAPDKGALNCWTKLAAALDKFRQCVITCQMNAVRSPATFDQVTCVSQCRSTYDKTTGKLVAAGQCPACLDSPGQERLADKAAAYVNGRADALYCAGSAPLAHPYLTEFDVPTAGSGVATITLGPDDNFWFAERTAGKIGKITPAGVVTEFNLPSASSAPSGIAVGPDDNLWFTEQSADAVGRITPAGVITEYSVPTQIRGPTGITAGPDGNLWFTAQTSNAIGRLNVSYLNASPSFLFSVFSVPTAASELQSISAGPDGHLWFTEFSGGNIGRIQTIGGAVELPVPTASSGPDTIVSGPDGNLWFTEFNGNKIGRMAPDGTVTEYVVPAAGGPRGITVGGDGHLWFVESTIGYIGRLTLEGVFSEYILPNGASAPSAIAAAADGSLWFTETAIDKVGKIGLVGGGFAPPDLPTAACEIAVTRNLGQLAKCLVKCETSVIKANFKGKTFDRATCETADPFKSCTAKFNSASNKLLLTTGCPVCLGATQQAALRDQYVLNLTGVQDELFCQDLPSSTPSP